MCIDVASFMHAQAGINVFTDVVLLLYPLPLLPLLKFNKRQRSKPLFYHPPNDRYGMRLTTLQPPSSSSSP